MYIGNENTVHFRAKRMVTCHKGFILAAFRSLSQVASPSSACDISKWWSPPIFPALRAANPSALGTLSQAVTDPSAHPLCNFLSHVTSPSALREKVLAIDSMSVHEPCRAVTPKYRHLRNHVSWFTLDSENVQVSVL